MRAAKEIDKQLQEESDNLKQLYSQIIKYDESITRLKKRDKRQKSMN